MSRAPRVRMSQAADRMRVTAALTGYGSVGPTPGIRTWLPVGSAVTQSVMPFTSVTTRNAFLERPGSNRG
jgi:hypothetical protein